MWDDGQLNYIYLWTSCSLFLINNRNIKLSVYTQECSKFEVAWGSTVVIYVLDDFLCLFECVCFLIQWFYNQLWFHPNSWNIGYMSEEGKMVSCVLWYTVSEHEGRGLFCPFRHTSSFYMNNRTLKFITIVFTHPVLTLAIFAFMTLCVLCMVVAMAVCISSETDIISSPFHTCIHV